MNRKPPKTGLILLKLLLPDSEKEHVIGSFEASYNDLRIERNRIYAFFWFWYQVLLSIPSLTGLIFNRGNGMLNNYMKIAFRNIKRHKGYSFINIAGLAIGITCSVIIYLYVSYELSYDTFHEKSDRIYRVVINGKIGDTKIGQSISCAPLPAAMMNDYPEVENAVRIYDDNSIKVEYGNKTFLESEGFWADSTFFNIFSFKLLKGEKGEVLNRPGTVVLSKTSSEKYFGDADPINKTIILSDIPYEITGVMEDFPENSHFHFNFVASLYTYPRLTGMGWGNNPFNIYLLLQEGFDYRLLDAKFPEFTTKYHGRGNANWMGTGNYWEYYLQPLTDIHLKSNLTGEFEANGNSAYVYVFSIAALFILLIACVNFMNLTTAKSMIRAREVGVRKVIGSNRGMLVKQFLAESIVLSLISLAVSLVLIKILLPHFNDLIGQRFELHYFDSIYILPALIALSLCVGILSGIYPAFIISAYKPAAVLKSSGLSGKRKGASLRNALVVFQFSISVFLLIGTQTVYKQLEFIRNQRLGFDKEKILVIENPLQSLGTNSKAFKDVIQSHGNINNSSYSRSIPGRSFSNWRMRPERLPDTSLNLYICDFDFKDVYQMEIVKGRFISEEFSADTAGIVINETCARILDWDDPIGKTFRVGRDQIYTVTGIVKDIYYESMHETIRPMGFLYGRRVNYLSIKMGAGDVTDTMNYIQNTWDDMTNGLAFEYFFFDDDYDKLYNNEMYTGKVFIVFSFMAVFIASLGVFGLASFIAERATKEIGIRKVLGGTASGLVIYLSKDFVKLAVLSNLIAWPVGFYLMDRWLQDFAYRTDIGLSIFIFAGLAALSIAVFAVSFKSIKAANANPVYALRYE